MTESNTATVRVEINGIQFDADVEYHYDAGVPAKLDGLPEDCYPEEPAEVSAFGLFVYLDHKKEPVDMGFLLEIEAISEEIEDQIFDLIEAGEA